MVKEVLGVEDVLHRSPLYLALVAGRLECAKHMIRYLVEYKISKQWNEFHMHILHSNIPSILSILDHLNPAAKKRLLGRRNREWNHFPSSSCSHWSYRSIQIISSSSHINIIIDISKDAFNKNNSALWE